MAQAAFDFGPFLKSDAPPAAARWSGFPKYNFIGGHNDPENIPTEEFIAAATAVLRREAHTLATYNLESGSQGYKPLRDFLAKKLKRHAGIVCTADDITMVSGSNHGLDLVNTTLISPGDTIVVEQDNYASALSRLRKCQARIIGLPQDRDGMRMDALASTLDRLKGEGVKPKYVYTIPTIQNPTSTIMTLERRQEFLRLTQAHGVPIFEDECYSDLVFDGKRPPALYALDQMGPKAGNVIFVGSFSKSIAPALRSGYLVAPWPIMSRILGYKTDGGSAAIEQMILAEYCEKHFFDHVDKLNKVLSSKLDTLIEALGQQFGTAAEFERPPGGIFLWIKLPDSVDTTKLTQIAGKEGVAINPGVEWTTNPEWGVRRLRICFANPSHQNLREGVAKLAEICNREFGVPTRIGNVARG